MTRSSEVLVASLSAGGQHHRVFRIMMLSS